MSVEFIVYTLVGCILLLVSGFVYWFSNLRVVPAAPKVQEQGGNDILRHNRAVGNRRQIDRNRRERIVNDSDSEGEGNHEAGGDAQRQAQLFDEKLNDPKFGAKKRAKLEAKAQKQQQREAEERMRQERKAKEALEQKEREERAKQEAEDEKRKEQVEKRFREEKVQREMEDYMKMKEMFTVEAEGCGAVEEEDEGNLIEKFLDHIKAKKVVLFEEIATQFGLKVPDAIDRLKILVNEGRLTGVVDDRGKFIYISEEELGKVAKFIKKRGRVSIADLGENSAKLITLISEIPETILSNK